jgi:sugar transferase EpsL
MIRLFDFFFSLLGIIILSPILILLYIIILFENSPPVFKQKRIGLNQKIFILVKFRTMRIETISAATHLVNNSMITPFGKLLRYTKLDEIPQLWNVLKGDMSLVGPRPLKIDYLDIYSKEQKRRHILKPGVTGWAQVNGRNAISHTRKFELDVWYVNNVSFILDVKILYLTVLKVIKKDGVGEKGVEVNAPFDGTN